MTENVTLPRRLVDQVMDALEDSRVDYDYHGNPFDVRDVKVVEATKALRNALEQPQAEREPVATVSTVIYGPQTAIDIDWNDRLADWPTCLQAHILYTPQGWKLVPSTLTDSQRQAAQDAWWNACNAEMYWDRIYAAMLDAAPQPPVVEQGQVGYMRWKNGSAEYVSKKGFDTPIDELWHPVYIYPQDKPDRLQIRKRIQDAFFEGFNSVETHNDTRLVSIDEAWETYVESVTDL